VYLANSSPNPRVSGRGCEVTGPDQIEREASILRRLRHRHVPPSGIATRQGLRLRVVISVVRYFHSHDVYHRDI
jgi:hypothetical protein